MREKAKVEENSSYVKDMTNFAILNTNKSVVVKHQQKMAELQRNKKVEEEINSLKSEVSDIKIVLNQILKAVGGEK